MESMGFVYSSYLTKKMRKTANKDWKRSDFLRAMQNHSKKTTFGVGQHLIKTLQVSCANELRSDDSQLNLLLCPCKQVFINPLVASLPEHSHLLAEVSYDEQFLRSHANVSSKIPLICGCCLIFIAAWMFCSRKRRH